MAKPGFSFLVCADSALLKGEIDRQLEAGTASAKWKRAIFWGDEEPEAPFWEALTQSGLFSENRAVIVRQAEAWPAAVWKQISSALASGSGNIWPFFCLEVGWEKGKFKIPAHIQKTRCFTFAEKKGWCWKSQGLIGGERERFIQNQAKKLGIQFEQNAFSDFIATAPFDATALCAEMQKLALLAKDGKVTSHMLASGGAATESDAFNLVKKLQNGDLAGCWREITTKNDDALLFLLIALLARELRLLWQINAGEEPRLYPGEAQRKRALARNMGQTRIAEGFSRLADSEWQVKSGRQTPMQTLEKLCVDMTRLFTKY